VRISMALLPISFRFNAPKDRTCFNLGTDRAATHIATNTALKFNQRER
jgi:hypothetical protein